MENEIACWICDGTGTIDVVADTIDSWARWEEEPCNRCGGSGRIKVDGTPTGIVFTKYFGTFYPDEYQL